ncbi:hypothetical protein [Methanofollis fontis]|uniref:hypothetical protein n=1 Tax=Methanofollis fontis TaxID=2052832 RepID=UPI0013EEA72A|nr:hypothetical protein [Methanofollis fontis]
MEDTTFSAIAERARTYPVVLRKSQMSKVTYMARPHHAERRSCPAPLPCMICV